MHLPSLVSYPVESLAVVNQSPETNRAQVKKMYYIERNSAPKFATIVDTTVDHRWSEIVPEDSGLAFAAFWDAEDGLVSFSGAELLALKSPTNSDTNTLDSPADVFDSHSDIYHDSSYDSPFAVYRETQGYFVSKDTPISPAVQGHTRASSTSNGLDVYHRPSPFLKLSELSKHWSCFDKLDEDPQFDPQTAFAGISLRRSECHSDEGFFESTSPLEEDVSGQVMNSSFSVTTTSTSEYVDLGSIYDESCFSSAWTTIEAPPSSFGSSDYSMRRRRLHKARPSERVADPLEVLAREEYNHDTKPLPAESSGSSGLTKFFGKLRCNSSADRWVCVEVKHTIKQRIL